MRICLFILIIAVNLNYLSAQDHPRIEGFTFVQQFGKNANLPNELIQKLARDNNIYSSFNAKKMGYSDKVSKEFNSMFELFDEEYFYAINVNESSTESIGFYSKEKGLLQHYILGFDAHIQLSENEEYISVYNMMGNQIFIFRKDGKLIFKGNSKILTNSSDNLNNIFIDENGEKLWVNLQYKLYCIDINSLNIEMEINISSWRIFDIYYNNEKEILFLKGDFPHEGVGCQEKAVFKFTIISLKNKEEINTIDCIRNMKVIEKKLYLLIDKNWNEYDIN